MLKTLRAAAFGIGLVLSVAPGYCSTITPLGLLTGTFGNDSRKFGQENATGQIEDYFTFSVDKRVDISASVTSSFSSMTQYINDFTIELFKGAPPLVAQFVVLAANDPIASGTNSVPNHPVDSEGAKLKALGQVAGDYYLKITGNTAGSPSYSGSLAIAISTVPLPASAPMFGAAVLALGLAGYGLKKRKDATNAA